MSYKCFSANPRAVSPQEMRPEAVLGSDRISHARCPGRGELSVGNGEAFGS